MKKQNEQKQYTRFIPTLVKEKLDELDYKRKDDLYCILDQIYRKQINYKTELQKTYSYVEIPQSVFRKLIPRKEFIREGLDFLLKNNIIEINKHHQVGVFSRGYRIQREFLSKKIVMIIEDKNINKRISLIETENREFKDKVLKFSQSNYYKNFKIDLKGAYNFIYNEALTSLKLLAINSGLKLTDEQLRDVLDAKNDYRKTRHLFAIKANTSYYNIIHKFTSQHYKILIIDNGYLYFKRNNTNGRLDTNLTNLPTTLRQFLVSDETLYNIDIKNSQPYFLYALLKVENVISTEELEKYGKLVVDGIFYEYLVNEWEKQFGELVKLSDSEKRKKMKGYLFKIFFSKVGSFSKIKTFFSTLFPEIMQYINEQNKSSNAIIANKLSTVESTTVIGVIIPKLGESGIKPFTIHDSFVCKESEIEAIIDTINTITLSMYGISPSLHVKTLIEDSNDDTEVENIEEIEIDEGMELELSGDFLTDYKGNPLTYDEMFPNNKNNKNK